MEAFRTELDGSEAKTGACTFKSECWNSNAEVRNIEQGTRNIEQEAKNIEQGTRNIEQEAKNIEQGTRNIEQEAKNIEQRTRNIEQEVRNIEQGAKNTEQGARNIERLPWRVSLLATHAEPEPLIRITCLKATFYTYSR